MQKLKLKYEDSEAVNFTAQTVGLEKYFWYIIIAVFLVELLIIYVFNYHLTFTVVPTTNENLVFAEQILYKGVIPTLINFLIVFIFNRITSIFVQSDYPFFQAISMILCINCLALNIFIHFHYISGIYPLFFIGIIFSFSFLDKIIFFISSGISFLFYFTFLFIIKPFLNTSERNTSNAFIELLIFIIFIYIFYILLNYILRIFNSYIQKKKEAETDSFTRLLNNEAFRDNLGKCIFKYQKNNKPFSIILWDIDNFKSINDTYGHDRGDDVIMALVNSINNNKGEKDLAFRYGGEELVLITYLQADNAKNLSTRVRNEFTERCYRIGLNKTITASGGICEYSSYDFPFDFYTNINDISKKVFKAADDALYIAKGTAGKNIDIVWRSQYMPYEGYNSFE